MEKSTVLNRHLQSKWFKTLWIALEIEIVVAFKEMSLTLFFRRVSGDVVQQINLSDNADNDGTFFLAVAGSC